MDIIGKTKATRLLSAAAPPPSGGCLRENHTSFPMPGNACHLLLRRLTFHKL